MPTGSTKSGPSTATSGTNNSVSTLALPDWFSSAWQSLLSQGSDLNNNLNYTTAGLTPDQMTSSTATNNLLDSWLSRPQIPAYDVFGMASTPNLAQHATIPSGTQANASALQSATPGVATAAQSDAAQLYPTQIAPFMSPYLNSVIDPTLSHLQQQQWDTSGRIAADAAAGGMFGGSRGAVANAIGDRDYRTNLAQTAGTLLNQGWTQATADAVGNVSNRQATNINNAGLQNAVALQNAQNATQASIANAQNATSRANNAASVGGQLTGQQLSSDMQTNLFNAGAQNTVANNDANRFLAALAQQGNMDTQSLQGTLSIIQQLNQLGTQQQGTAQNSLNSFWTQLNNLAKLLSAGGNPGGTTTLTGSTTGTGSQQSPVDLSSALLGGLGVLGKASTGSILGNILGFSDREDKTDITELGKDKNTGVPMYAFRYKDDPKTYPKVVGPMAQDLEKVMPGITRLIGGHRVVEGYGR